MEVKIGNRYLKEICTFCNEKTVHRVFKRFGKAKRGKGEGKFSLKRKVTYCLTCQKRRIEKSEKRKRY